MNEIFEVIEFNEALASASQTLLNGRPDLWKQLSIHQIIDDAVTMARDIQKSNTSRIAIRRVGDEYPLLGHENYYNILKEERELSEYARLLGKRGGKSKSPAKQNASRINGKLGGRPKN